MLDCDGFREVLMPNQEASTYHIGHRSSLIEILNFHHDTTWSDIFLERLFYKNWWGGG